MSGAAHDNRVLGGYKATLSNPNTSDAAKEHAREVLDGASTDTGAAPSASFERAGAESDGATKHDNQVRGGYKAALKNPNVSDEAKRHAQEVLERGGAPAVEQEFRGDGAAAQGSEGETNRVLGGYKATIHNPRTSEGAKEHAREVLREHDALE